MTTKTTTKATKEPCVKATEADQSPAARPDPKDVTVYDAVGRTPGITISQIATTIGWGRSTVTKSVARMTKQGLLTRNRGGHDGTRRLPDTFTRTGATAKPAEVPAAKEKAAKARVAEKKAPSTKQSQRDEPANDPGRLGKGELAELVARLLAEHPSVEFGPSQIAKELNRSAGAIANALDKMTKSGAVLQVQAKPKRYKLKATS